MSHISPESALHRLKHGELCIVVLHDSTQREAEWNPDNARFYFTSAPPGSVSAAEVYEWWPASVKF